LQNGSIKEMQIIYLLNSWREKRKLLKVSLEDSKYLWKQRGSQSNVYMLRQWLMKTYGGTRLKPWPIMNLICFLMDLLKSMVLLYLGTWLNKRRWPQTTVLPLKTEKASISISVSFLLMLKNKPVKTGKIKMTNRAWTTLMITRRLAICQDNPEWTYGLGISTSNNSKSTLRYMKKPVQKMRPILNTFISWSNTLWPRRTNKKMEIMSP